MVTGLTLTNVPEAIGIANAASQAGVPCVISFTLETDGRLPTGERLSDAITQVDAQANTKPAYFMINCAHPDHFTNMIPQGADWVTRIGGVRANASRMSHAELDCCETLDDGDPVELGAQYAGLRQRLPNLTVFGGCCGTDHRHLSQICRYLTT
jgi:S-methylmethionine-dependent homocysteine/selenocysteine methylase